MAHQTVTIATHGERFYDITRAVTDVATSLYPSKSEASGILHLFILHTSCALTLSEAYDPTAREDLEAFLKQLAPRNLSFIRHTLEGEDDSPSHMKSILLQQHLAIPVEKGAPLLGRWQGIYLAEFRDAPHQRRVVLKFQSDGACY